MKILMLTPYLPYPPASGGQIRTLNLLKYLSRTNDITLVALYKNEKEKQYASALKSFCKEIHVCKRAEKPWQPGNVLKSVFSFLPFLIVRNFSYEAQDVVERLLKKEKFDAIHAETFYIMPHIPKTSVPILLVEQTIEFKVYQHFVSTLPIFLRFALYIDIVKLKFWEIFYWKKASLVAAVSASDKGIIQSFIHKNTPVVVIPNGAGDEMFVSKIPEKDTSKPTLLFVGNFYWLQNTEAAHYMLKFFGKLRSEIPDIRLIIAGQNVANKLADVKQEGVDIIDIAPDDDETIKKLYSSSTIFVAPIFGPGGTRLKILAAMASGLPIVSSKTGVEGLQVEDGKHVVVAETGPAFVEGIKRLLKDKKLYRTLQDNAFNLVRDNYSWSAIANKLEVDYKNIPPPSA